MLLTAYALAYETDQLTRRGEPLADVTAVANDFVNQRLHEAAVRTNAETRCEASDVDTQRILGREIAALLARPEYIKERKLAGYGYSAYAAFLETAEFPRRAFLDRTDIFGAIRPGESVVLANVGICSTVRLAGQLVGTDKPDHFWMLGYQYALASGWGAHPDRAIRWGTFTERAFYGMLTSDVFSYGDLAANAAGHEFFVGLLTSSSVLQRDAAGCVVLQRPFDWTEWVEPAWDEVLNPPVMDRAVGQAVQARLTARRSEYCADYLSWRDDYLPQLARVMGQRAPYVSGRAPKHHDPFGLEALCTPEIVIGLREGQLRVPGPVDTEALLDLAAP